MVYQLEGHSYRESSEHKTQSLEEERNIMELRDVLIRSCRVQGEKWQEGRLD